MSDFNWDEFAGGGDGSFVAFKELGDSVTGEVLAVRIGKDFNGGPAPELVLRDDAGDERIVTAGQKVLQSALASIRPTVGERIGIAYSGVGEAKPGKAPAKLFTVQVRGTDGTVRSTEEQGSTPAPAATPAPAPAAATSLI